MKITAANGLVYDLENLSEADKRILQTLGHLPKETAAAVVEETPPSVKKAKKDESI